MNTQLKYIVDELNVLFPSRSFNIIAFDSLNADQLLQVISNVLTCIECNEDIDIRDEGKEQSVKRILDTLHVLKYKAPNQELELAQALLVGDKINLLPLLQWLLQNRVVLEKRAYLARFLIRVEIPTHLRGEPVLEELNETYEQMMEAFKDAHRERESLVSSSASTAELRGDLAVMERERDLVAVKVASHHKSRVENSKAAAALLSRVQALRETRDKRETLSEQRARLEVSCSELERFVSRAKQQVTEARRASQGITPQGLLQRAEEEQRVSVYISQEKLPTDLETMQAQVQILQQVTGQSALSRADLAQVEQDVRALSVEVNALLERRLAAAGPTEDKLAPFRQQAAMLGRRKEAAAESLGTLKRESMTLKAQFQELQEQLAEGEGNAAPSEDQFRSYVTQLRARTEVYKARRSQLSALTAECGVQARTVEILRAKQDAAHRMLAAEEARLGLSGFTVASTQMEEVSATKAELDSQKERTLESLSKAVLELNQLIAAKKALLGPAIQELRPLREEYQAALSEYTQKKQVYDATATNLGSASDKLEQEVKQIQEECSQAFSQSLLTQAKIKVSKAQQETLAQELILYKGGAAEKKKSLREQLSLKIAEEERRGRQLKESQKGLKDSEAKDERQVALWQNLERLFSAKQQWLQDVHQNSAKVRRERGAETLVLQ